VNQAGFLAPSLNNQRPEEQTRGAVKRSIKTNVKKRDTFDPPKPFLSSRILITRRKIGLHLVIENGRGKTTPLQFINAVPNDLDNLSNDASDTPTTECHTCSNNAKIGF
jgi:hypothetical protein